MDPNEVVEEMEGEGSRRSYKVTSTKTVPITTRGVINQITCEKTGQHWRVVQNP